MFHMSDLTIALWFTEKYCTFPFKDTSWDSVASNSLDMLLRQNSVRKFTILL